MPLLALELWGLVVKKLLPCMYDAQPYFLLHVFLSRPLGKHTLCAGVEFAGGSVTSGGNEGDPTFPLDLVNAAYVAANNGTMVCWPPLQCLEIRVRSTWDAANRSALALLHM